MELTPELKAMLAELAPCHDPIRLQQLTLRLEPALSLILEIMEPDQAAETTRLELTDLYLRVRLDQPELARIGYDQDKIAQFGDSIVATRSFQELLQTGLSGRSFQTRTVEEVLAASLPWRQKLRRVAQYVFFFDQPRLAIYQDHNESETIEEEISDLRMLTQAVVRDAKELARANFGPEDRVQGEQLLLEAEGRDVLALLGIRSQADARIVRNRYLSLAVTLGRFARTAGQAVFHDQPTRREPYERANFRRALRRIHPHRASNLPPAEPAVTPATSEPPSVTEPAEGPV